MDFDNIDKIIFYIYLYLLVNVEKFNAIKHKSIKPQCIIDV